MERVQSDEYYLYVYVRKVLQPTARQLERVQRGVYGRDVCVRKFFQPTARQMERVQSEEYELYVCGRNLLQPTAPRSLVRGRAVRIGMTASTFFGLVIWRFAI